ncbi:neutrophil gelatinase-associated lipocalin [Ochotona princeps]|uniref:neutrophil gelatinase-associated lipocalin n=1 Tax=Ochotona princeps TaxID=9978 RepID=UPI0027146047|nr:neutrophil gelatinase-associated lipocalin [Ochotona princeps]
MSLGILWLGLILLGALHTQAQELTTDPTPSPRLIPVPSLRKIHVQKNFQSDQFQGKWYVVGLAGNNIHNSDQEHQMYSTTYELKEDGSYNVTSTLLRNQQCDHWIRTFVPGSKLGHFNLGNIKSYPTLKSYLIRVVTTDYNQFAIVFFRKVYKNNKKFFKIVLYGRTKELSPELRGRFTSFAKTLGLTDNHIVFPAPIGQCIDD